MTRPAADKVRFDFASQLPRDDGCGIFVLQMLTGKPYDQIAGMIEWKGRTGHHTTWADLRGALTGLGWRIGAVRKVDGWSDVEGVAVVHVEADHFILYDADNGVFYDPGQPEGPALHTRLVPISCLPVQPSETTGKSGQTEPC